MNGDITAQYLKDSTIDFAKRQISRGKWQAYEWIDTDDNEGFVIDIGVLNGTQWDNEFTMSRDIPSGRGMIDLELLDVHRTFCVQNNIVTKTMLWPSASPVRGAWKNWVEGPTGSQYFSNFIEEVYNVDGISRFKYTYTVVP